MNAHVPTVRLSRDSRPKQFSAPEPQTLMHPDPTDMGNADAIVLNFKLTVIQAKAVSLGPFLFEIRIFEVARIVEKVLKSHPKISQRVLRSALGHLLHPEELLSLLFQLCQLFLYIFDIRRAGTQPVFVLLILFYPLPQSPVEDKTSGSAGTGEIFRLLLRRIQFCSESEVPAKLAL